MIVRKRLCPQAGSLDVCLLRIDCPPKRAMFGFERYSGDLRDITFRKEVKSEGRAVLHRPYILRRIISRPVYLRGNFPGFHLVRITGFKKRYKLLPVLNGAVKLEIFLILVDDDGHSVMDGPQQFAGRSGVMVQVLTSSPAGEEQNRAEGGFL